MLFVDLCLVIINKLVEYTSVNQNVKLVIISDLLIPVYYKIVQNNQKMPIVLMEKYFNIIVKSYLECKIPSIDIKRKVMGSVCEGIKIKLHHEKIYTLVFDHILSLCILMFVQKSDISSIACKQME